MFSNKSMEDYSYTVGDVTKFLKKLQKRKKKKEVSVGHLTDLFVNPPCCDNNQSFYSSYLHSPSITKEENDEKVETEKTEEEEESEEENDSGEEDMESGDEDYSSDSDHSSKEKPQKPTKKPKTDGTPKDVRTIFVGNIPLKVDKKKLMKEFEDYGQIHSVRMRSLGVIPLLVDSSKRHRVIFVSRMKAPSHPGVSKQLVGKTLDIHEKRENYNAYIVYTTREAAERATEKNGAVLDGFHLRVDLTRNAKKNDSKRSIFLGGLPYDINEEDVRSLFEDYGDMESVRVVRDNATGMGKGFGFIVFKDPSSVALALKMNSQKLQGRRIRVKPVETKPDGRKSGPGIGKESSTQKWRRLDQKGRKRMRYKMKLKKRKAQDLATQGKRVNEETRDKPQKEKTAVPLSEGKIRTKPAEDSSGKTKPFRRQSGFGASKDLGKRPGGGRQKFGGSRNSSQGKVEFSGRKIKFDQ